MDCPVARCPKMRLNMNRGETDKIVPRIWP
jgi:hypothetical protein